MSRARVIVATRIFTPEVAAGAFRLEALTRALGRWAEVEVVTATVPDHGSHGYTPPAGVRVRRFPVRRDSDGYVRGYLPYLSFDLPLTIRLLRGRRPVAVIVEPPPTTGVVVRVIAALRRTPYFWYAADVWSDAAATTGAPRAVVAAVRAMERWVVRGAAGVLSVSDGVTERVRDLGAGRVVTVGNGIDTEVFGPGGERRGDARTLVYAGTASEWQGAEVFARAMPRVLESVPQARLVYLGQGSAWERIGEIAARVAPEAIAMVGMVPAAQSAAWLRGSAAGLVSIVPGQGYDFAVPTKLFAALGTGTPVIYAGAGPVRELVAEHQLGWATDHEVDAVADAMIAALTAEPDTERERARRAAWVAGHRSLRAVAERAAGVVRDHSRG